MQAIKDVPKENSFISMKTASRRRIEDMPTVIEENGSTFASAASGILELVSAVCAGKLIATFPYEGTINGVLFAHWFEKPAPTAHHHHRQCGFLQERCFTEHFRKIHSDRALFAPYSSEGNSIERSCTAFNRNIANQSIAIALSQRRLMWLFQGK